MTDWPTRLRRASWLLAPILVLAYAGEARAGENEKQAQSLFVEAMKLMARKQFGEACAKLAKSQELDPGMGTQFRLAECYEKLGRLASAYDQYTAVAEAAKAASKHDREAVAKRRAAALETKVAKLTITIAPAVAALPGVEVVRDGAPVEQKLWGTPIPVDPGDHIVTVRAPAKKAWENKVWAEVSAKLVVTVGSLEDVAPPPEVRGQKSLVPTIVLAAAGGVGVVLGATFVGLRAAAAGEAETLHDSISKAGNNCVGGGKGKLADDCASLSKATSRGDTFGTASLVSFIVGGAALAGMTTYLLLPAPKVAPAATGVRFAPAVGAGQAGLVAWGTFR